MGATPKRTIRRTRRVTKGRARKRPARRAKRVSVSRRNKKSRRTTRTTLTRRGKGKQRAGAGALHQALGSSHSHSVPVPMVNTTGTGTEWEDPSNHGHPGEPSSVPVPPQSHVRVPPVPQSPVAEDPHRRSLQQQQGESQVDPWRIESQRVPVGGQSCGTDGSGAQCRMSDSEYTACVENTQAIMEYVKRPYTGIHCLHEYQLDEYDQSETMAPPCHCELPRFDSTCAYPDETIEWAEYKTSERNVLEAVYLDETCAYCEPTEPNYQMVYNRFLGKACSIPNPNSNLLTKAQCVQVINNSTSSLNECANDTLVSLIEVFGFVGAMGIIWWCSEGCPTGRLRIGLRGEGRGIRDRIRDRIQERGRVRGFEQVQDGSDAMDIEAPVVVVQQEVVQQQPLAFNAAGEIQKLSQAIGTKCDDPSIYEGYCAICLEDLLAPASMASPIEDEDRGEGRVVQTHCPRPHYFHFNCMMNLLMAGQERCPCCRHRLGLTRVQVHGPGAAPASASASAPAPAPEPESALEHVPGSH